MRIALIVDNPYRDLPGLVLTASYLCQRGSTCHLVPMNLLRSEIWHLAPDFVLLNYLRSIRQEFTRELMDAGIKVGVLDTEGGVLPSFDCYAKTMAADSSVRHRIECFCSWGSKLATHAVEQGWYLDKQISITGSPRFDFYVQPWCHAALKNSDYVDDYPKPIVLINGNFPLANPGFKTPEEEIRLLVDHFGYDEKEILYRQKLDRGTMLDMAKLTNHLAAHFNNVTFVYRPHPFERLDAYNALLDSRSNLHLSRQGTVDGWILRSSAVIQRSCSTAIEAGLARVPALSPIWIPTAVVQETAESVSIPCESENNLFNYLDAILKGQQEIPDTIHTSLKHIIADWFYRIDGNAHQRVGDGILNSAISNGSRVRLDHCNNMANRQPILGTGLKTITVEEIKHALRIPANWSLRHMRYMRNDKSWDGSEKYFSEGDVRSILDSIMASSPIEEMDGLEHITVQSAQERGDYQFVYEHGRSVTVFPR